ncbi:unnamed protein product [Amoebophrya sp. A25]|nr:unnamed protein product [Amoebophrya sp. A25]|eukprot:GSA25T00005210001.1
MIQIISFPEKLLFSCPFISTSNSAILIARTHSHTHARDGY